MKYKTGDKVKIKTWEEMEKEFGLYEDEDIKCHKTFIQLMERSIETLDTDRVLTIKTVNGNDYYTTIETNWNWSDDMIKCLASDYKEPVPIYTRFEILDL